jgi:transposase
MGSEKLKIDLIIEDIINGDRYRAIAAKYKVALSTFADFLAKPEHSARVQAALMTSADTFAEKAEEVLELAKSNMIEVTRARELAHHYRWMAAKRYPKRYNEKVEHSGEIKGINVVIK